jgi:AcrR family transcriptional regulator
MAKIDFVTANKEESCKRPYSLGKRLESSDRTRGKVLDAARSLLESNGFLGFTLDGLAREGGVSRQTVHNLFGTKTGVLEALFDRIALDAGMDRMRGVMQQTDPVVMLASFVEVFAGFWTKDRMLLRRVHGIAAIDPEFGAAVEARNRRRKMAAARIIDVLERQSGRPDAAAKAQKAATLYALTSFEFFDVLADGCGSAEEAARELAEMVKSLF